MSARDELTAILRTIQSAHVVPDVPMVERIVALVGTDRILAVFTLDMVNDLIVDHEEAHGRDGAPECARCSGLEDIVRDLEGARLPP
jgi:hypothetical protein